MRCSGAAADMDESNATSTVSSVFFSFRLVSFPLLALFPSSFPPSPSSLPPSPSLSMANTVMRQASAPPTLLLCSFASVLLLLCVYFHLIKTLASARIHGFAPPGASACLGARCQVAARLAPGDFLNTVLMH